MNPVFVRTLIISISICHVTIDYASLVTPAIRYAISFVESWAFLSTRRELFSR